MAFIKTWWQRWRERVAERYMQHPHLGYYVAHVIGGDGTIPGQMLGDGEIELTDELLVGAGGHRECYRHPQDRKLCIKITVSHDKRQSVRELTYYAILERRGIAWDMLPRSTVT